MAVYLLTKNKVNGFTHPLHLTGPKPQYHKYSRPVLIIRPTCISYDDGVRVDALLCCNAVSSNS